VLQRNFGVGICAHVTISHSNEWGHPPYAFQHPSFWSSLDIISIYVLSKYQGEILNDGGVSWPRNLWGCIFAHAAISHSTECRKAPSAFQHSPLWLSLYIISVYVLSKYQGEILNDGGGSCQWNFGWAVGHGNERWVPTASWHFKYKNIICLLYIHCILH
jgi:hypothetical protein